MKMARLGWAAWSVLPVFGLAYHYGPGQQAWSQERAADLQKSVATLEQEALAAQRAAHAAHLAALAARRETAASPTPHAEAKSREAADAESREFQKASAAWRRVADAWGRIQELADRAPDGTRWRIRWSRSRALVRSGDIWTGIGELESILAQIEKAGRSDLPVAWATREELASAYYYGARLMRLSGDPPAEWLVESGKARQHFRYLAEQAQAGGRGQETAVIHQRNVELVLDLEQDTLLEVEGKPLPQDSPLGRSGNRPGRGEGKSRRPPQGRDGRGASGAETINRGW